MSDGSARRRTVASMMSRTSQLSTKSRSSVFMKIHKGILGVSVDPGSHRQEGLKWWNWLLASAEFFVSFSWRSFMARAQSERTLRMRQMTPRDETLERLFYDGWSAMGNVLMGHLADSYTGNYGIVMINVAIHFALSCFFLMSEIISDTASEDEYGLLLSHVFLWSYIPIRATDFARVVYGMEQLPSKGYSLVIYFSFIFQFADRLGAFVYQVAKTSGLTPHAVTFMAFAANGVVLCLYAYVLLPTNVVNLQFSRGIAVKVWGCVMAGLRNKRKYGHRLKKKSWLDFAEARYDKTHVSKTKMLLKLFTLILPTAGFLFITNSYDDIFDIFWSSLNYSGKTGIYTFWVVRSTSLMTMLFLEFLFNPFLLWMNVKVSFLKRFLLGYLALLFAILFATVVMTLNEKFHMTRSVGVLRVINVRNEEVSFKSEDQQFSTLNYRVDNHSAKLINYIVDDLRLFPVTVRFNNESEYQMHMSVRPHTVTSYLAVEPDLFFRIRGHIPVLDAPPGFNDQMMPRCFVANFVMGKDFQLRVQSASTKKKSLVTVSPGMFTVFQVEEGEYTFTVEGTSAKTTHTVLIGGIYGIYMYLDLEDYRIVVDKVVRENFIPPIMGLGVSIPIGLVDGLAFVALLAFVFTNAPDGLKGVSVGYLQFLGNLTSWFLLIGFYTWHPYITADTLLMFTFVVSTLFFACVLLLLKYKSVYKMYLRSYMDSNHRQTIPHPFY